MSLVQASTSAAYLAHLRAIESNRPPDKRLFYDPYAKLFLPPILKYIEKMSTVGILNRCLSWCIDKHWPGARTSTVARTRLIDVMITNTIDEKGVNQLIIFGAGYDCRALRLKLKRPVYFVEVDHPKAQNTKRGILDKAFPGQLIDAATDYVAIDLHTQQLEEVIPNIFRKSHYKTMFLWEGVMNRLTAHMTSKVFQYFKRFRPGTLILFTYVDQQVLDHPERFPGADNVIKLLRCNNEFWNFGLDPHTIKDFLATYNMELLHDLGANDYRHTYYGDKADKMKGYEFYRVAMAVVK